MRRSTGKALSRSALIAALFGTWTLASCDFLAGDSGGSGGGPGVTGSSPAPLPAPNPPLATQRVSSLPPTEANLDSYAPSISRNGLFVAYYSYASNLEDADTINQPDVFVTDLTTGSTERVSKPAGGGNDSLYSFGGSVSDDGQQVAFYSYSTLVPLDNNGTSDVFVRDRLAGTTVRVSVDSLGAGGNNASYNPTISADGRFVVFYSIASNLVPGDTNGAFDVFVHDRDPSGNGFDGPDISTVRVSVDSAGVEGNSSSFAYGTCISNDGQFVVFYSYSDNLDTALAPPGDTNGQPDAFIHDRDPGNDGLDGPDQSTTLISLTTSDTLSDGPTYSAAISDDGTQVAFYSYGGNLVPGDTNGTADTFVRNITSGSTVLVSLSTGGVLGSDYSVGYSISDTGRFIVFYSYAGNLVPGDTNGTFDLFIRDRDPNNDGLDGPDATTTRLSVDTFLNQGNNYSFDPSISADGTRVVFYSYASNLILGDSNGRVDIFLRDLSGSGTTRRISQGTAPGGNGNSQDPSVDATGLIMAFSSPASNLIDTNGDGLFNDDTNGQFDIFVRDVTGGPCQRVSVSSSGAEATGGASFRPSMSANGRFVAFDSTATNLVANDFNGNFDVFVRDLAFGITTRVSVTSAGGEATGGTSVRPSISSDGRLVVFESSATNLVAGDLNSAIDIFVHDRLTGTTTLVSVNSAGAQGNFNSSAASISPDGRFVAFESDANNLVDSDNDGVFNNDTNATRDIFVRDLQSGTTTIVSVDSAGAQGNGFSFRASISRDGLFVAFDSLASNLVTGDTNGAFDVFVRDVAAGVTTRVSVNSAGGEGTSSSLRSSISEDGRFVAFDSGATNFVDSDNDGLFDDDVNGGFDVFRHDRLSGQTICVSVDSKGNQALIGLVNPFPPPPSFPPSSNIPAISADGSFVAFQSSAADLLAEDTENFTDIYLRGPLPIN
jgi:hypothetical protein